MEPTRTYINGTTRKDAVRYTVGEEIIFDLALYNDAGEVVPCPYFEYEMWGDDGKYEKKTVPGGCGKLTVSTSLSCPGFVRLIVLALGEDMKPLPGSDASGYNGGAGAEVERLTTGLPEPEDFDEFWAGWSKKLEAVEPVLIEKFEVPSGNPDFVAYSVKLPALGVMPTSGIITMPRNAEPGSLRGEASFQGYDYKSAMPICSKGAVHFHINSHGYDNLRNEEYYKDYEKLHPSFGLCDEGKPIEEFYFLYMILRDLQGVRYLMTLPEYDGDGIRLSGGSMGGMQATHIAHLIGDRAKELSILIPWFGDNSAIIAGRQRREFGPNVESADSNYLYLDTAYHAKRVKCPACVSFANLGDYVSPPATATVIYNNFPNKTYIKYVQNSVHGGCPAGVKCDTYTVEAK